MLMLSIPNAKKAMLTNATADQCYDKQWLFWVMQTLSNAIAKEC